VRVRSLVLVLFLAVASGARAQEHARPGASSVLDIADPARTAALRIRATARERLLDALNGPESERNRLLEQAVTRYDAVLATFPTDVDAMLERAAALTAIHHTPAEADALTRRTIDAYEAARAIDSGRDEAHVAFELAVLHAQRQEFAEAAAEYERSYAARSLPIATPVALALSASDREIGLVALFARPSEGTLLANWAEAAMLAGDAQTAIDRYRAALDLAAPGTDSVSLALWGLALAEERGGSHADAIETTLRAIDADHSADQPTRARIVERHGHFAALHLTGVFFEPACEIHAYEALGHEALASRASTAEGRTAEWTAARLSTRFFLAEGGRGSLYASVAEAAEARLTALLTR
jgi:tetratricopeptide (TPR) repeat protein